MRLAATATIVVKRGLALPNILVNSGTKDKWLAALELAWRPWPVVILIRTPPALSPVCRTFSVHGSALPVQQQQQQQQTQPDRPGPASPQDLDRRIHRGGNWSPAHSPGQQPPSLKVETCFSFQLHSSHHHNLVPTDRVRHPTLIVRVNRFTQRTIARLERRKEEVTDSK